MANKFESEEELLKSYTSLEKEFTRKCQELSRLKKELCEKGEREDNVKSEAFCGGNDEKMIGSFESAEQVIAFSGGEEPEEVEKEEILETEKVISGSDLGLGYRKKATEFLASCPDAREFSKEISKELLVNQELLKMDNPFYMAYLIVKDKNAKKMEKPVENNEKSVKNDEKSEITHKNEDFASDRFKDFPSLLKGTKSGGLSVPVKRKFSSFEDARQELISKYFS